MNPFTEPGLGIQKRADISVSPTGRPLLGWANLVYHTVPDTWSETREGLRSAYPTDFEHERGFLQRGWDRVSRWAHQRNIGNDLGARSLLHERDVPRLTTRDLEEPLREGVVQHMRDGIKNLYMQNLRERKRGSSGWESILNYFAILANRFGQRFGLNLFQNRANTIYRDAFQQTLQNKEFVGTPPEEGGWDEAWDRKMEHLDETIDFTRPEDAWHQYFHNTPYGRTIKDRQQHYFSQKPNLDNMVRGVQHENRWGNTELQEAFANDPQDLVRQMFQVDRSGWNAKEEYYQGNYRPYQSLPGSSTVQEMTDKTLNMPRPVPPLTLVKQYDQLWQDWEAQNTPPPTR